MTDKIGFINRALTYSFYALFAITPLVMFPTTYEIFEFNKMWFVFALSVLIAFLWGTKMVLTKKIEIKRSPLDIPILLFLLTQIIATIFSIDPYVSWWGYYSRFNGGLLSTITYVFLYFALTTHLWLNHEAGDAGGRGPDTRAGERSERALAGGKPAAGPAGNKRQIPELNELKSLLSIKILIFSLFGGILVALWGLPSHFGYDPTCFVFGRGLSTQCWTDAFKPTIRIFSTLGQPNWLGAYLAALIPLSLAFAAIASKKEAPKIPFMQNLKLIERKHIQLFFTLTTILFFIDLLFTRSKSGYIGFWLGLLTTLLLYFTPIFYRKKIDINKIKNYPARQAVIILTIVLLALTFIIGIPLKGFEKYTLQGIIDSTKSQSTQNHSVQNPASTDALGGTDSGKIRLIVWQGALDVIKNYPLSGTGPETFGYIYYKYRPVEHNLTSEWDYLYNKAHNEYLNYAATSGIPGLLTYILVILIFAVSVLRSVKKRSGYKLVAFALAGGYVSVIISNFFGFSVVNTNLIFFLTPPLFYAILPANKYKSLTLFKGKENTKISVLQKTIIALLIIIALFLIYVLLNFWLADKQFVKGKNLNNAGEAARAHQYLENAVKKRPQEALYKSELALNLATLSYGLSRQGQSTQSAQLLQRAEKLSNEVTLSHPYNIVFYKNRTRTMYALAQVDPKYLEIAVDSIKQAEKLAPTDAKISYNVGILYAQAKKYEKAIEQFKHTISLKPDYRDPYYGTALVALQAAEEIPNESEKYREIAQKALQKLIDINPKDTQARDLLNSLKN